MYNSEINNNNNNKKKKKNKNGKKVNVGSTQGMFLKNIITIEVVLHRRYTGIRLVYLCVENQKEIKNRSYIEIEFFLNAETIRLVIDIVSYVWRES